MFVKFLSEEYTGKNALLRLVLVISIIICPFLVFAQAARDTLFINTDTDNYPVHKHLHILKSDEALKPETIYGLLKAGNWMRLYPERAYSEESAISLYYWVVVTIKNNLPNTKNLYYKLNSQPLNVVRAYEKVNGSPVRYLGWSGSDIPFASRAYHYYDIVFPVSVKPGETSTIMLGIANTGGDAIRFLPELSSENDFRAEEERFYLVSGGMTGIMLIVFLLNLFLGIALKEKLHLLYGLYIIVALYEIYTMKGIDMQYLYPAYPAMSTHLEYFAPCLLAILMTRVMQLFLNQKRENSKIKIFVDIGLALIVFMIVVNVAAFPALHTNSQVVEPYVNVLAILLLLQCLLFIASAIEKIIQGYKPAWFYLSAVSVFLIGLIEFIIMVLGGADQELVLKRSPNDIEIGIIVETIVVFLGIVYRYNHYKKEKEKLMLELTLQQQSLLEKIVGAEEAERKRIAEDLHDDVGATLSTLSMHLSNPQENVKSIMTLESYNKHSLNLSNKAFNDIRTIAHNLLPKDFMETGLFLTLEQRINGLNAGGPIRFTLILEGNEKGLNDVFAITIYRIVNELLSNIRKHSLASEAAIQLLIDEKEIQIMTEDDGIGFNSENVANGIGLKNIKGRVAFLNGNIHIDSNQTGTQTVINIPL